MLSDTYRSAARRLLESPQTLGTTAFMILRHTWGDDALDWDPLTLAAEFKDTFGVEPAVPVMDRLMAVSVVMLGDAFFRDAGSFWNISNTLASGAPGFSVMDPVTPEEAAWSITEVTVLRDMLPFSPSVQGFLKMVLSESGWTKGPYPAAFDLVFGEEGSSEQLVIQGARTAATEVAEGVDGYINETMGLLVAQIDLLGQMPELQRLLEEY